MSNLTGQSLGRYHILEQLGEGGMATVYRAHDMRLERDVAVKVIRADQFGSAHLAPMLKRFEREAKSLAKLSHPNILKVLDYGEHDGAPFLVMEFLPGGTLKERLGGKSLPWQESIRLLLPIAQALAYAHSENIVHRDIKPSNILITQSGEPMLSDFGIAKILEGEKTSELTATGSGIGTPEYMAPEQAMGKTDARVDIYALGVVLYQMITGHVPFRADTPMAVLLKKSTEALPRPAQYIHGLPGEVENVLVKALAREPENRYQSTRDFVTALQNLLEGKPVPAAKIPAAPVASAGATLVEAPPVTAQPSASRANNRMWIGAAGAIILLLICIVGGIALASTLTSDGPANPEPTRPPETAAPLTESTPDAAQTPTLLPSAIPTLPSPTALPPTEDPNVNPKDGASLAEVPAGEFLMGSDSFEPYFWGAEAPKHPVYLDAFWIYRTEVTNAMFRACVDAGACPRPEELSSRTHGDYFTSPRYDDYPVIHVAYEAALSYCIWVGARLPTEAEWEKAARGTDGRLFPWGNEGIANNLANFCDIGCPNTESKEIESGFDDGYRDVAPVGSFPLGASPYGALDMAGNVLEWVSDWYSASYYAISPYQNPTGPASGNRHPIRGGSWYSGREGLRPAARASLSPTSSYDTLGFRCAMIIQ
ncbi:MAG: SUMF1/EgtB/PvdO family nonheme iron enzyme [Chloroflexota bacterium]